MNEVAVLDIRVQTSEVARATENLEDLKRKGAEVERATDALTKSTERASRAASRASDSFRKTTDGLTKAGTAGRGARAALVDLAVATTDATEASDNLGKKAQTASHGLEKLSDSGGQATRVSGDLTSSADQVGKAISDFGLEVDRTAGKLWEYSQTAETAELSTFVLTESAGKADQAASKASDSFRKTTDELTNASAAGQDAGVALNDLATTATETAGAFDNLSKETRTASDELGKLSGSSQQAARASDSFTDSANRAGKATDGLGKEVNKTSNEFRQYSMTSKAAGVATDALIGAFKRFAVQVAAAYGVMASFRAMIRVQREFDALEAALTTVTGSVEKAAEAYQAISDFALVTPYDINQVVEAFIKLTNYGLEPSERALRSYGNTATSMGKTLEEMVNAVAAATTGNFQALKSFGILARNEGDQIVFTFQGVETSVKNSARAIEEYLMSIGETQFAGAMEARLGKLDDTILYLEEAYNRLLLSISRAGVGDFISRQLQIVIDGILELERSVASGQLPGYLKAWADLWSGWADDVRFTVGKLTEWFGGIWSKWKESASSTVSFIINAFKEFPINVRALLGIVTVELTAWVDRVIARVTLMKDRVKAVFTDLTQEEVTERFERRMEVINRAREESIDAIYREHAAARQNFQDQIAAADRLREEYDALAEARAKSQEDRLIQYRRSGSGDRMSRAEAEARRRAFESLVESLRTEEEAIEESYRRRRDIILMNTVAGSELQKDLLARLEADREAALKRYYEAQNRELEALRSSLLTQEEAIHESYQKRLAIIEEHTEAESELRRTLTERLQEEYNRQLRALQEAKQRERDILLAGLRKEEELIAESYERRRRAILESTILTEQERQEALAELARQHREAEEARNRAHVESILSHSEDLFENLARLAQGRNEEQTKAYKALFAISKAFSITQATMSIATGIAKAQELGFPANLAEMARVAAVGAQVLATISSSNFAGAYDQGGRIPAGKIGLVGEYGPEFVRGPAVVTSREDTRALIEKAARAQTPEVRPTNIRIVNAFDTSALGDYLSSDEGEEIVLNIIRRNRNIVRTVVGA